MSRKWGPTFVEGNPVGYGIKAKEDPWKWAIATTLEKEWGRHQLSVPLRATLRFFLSEVDPEGRLNYDITGLLECAVNGVAHVMTAPSKRGGHPSPWNHEDHWIVDINGSKELGQERPGLEVTLEEV